jgi:multimeric flavodoxin WrbA
MYTKKALGILGSPRRRGNTAKMLEATLEMLEKEDFEIETIYLMKKKINYCLGCGMCLAKGECIQEDDMVEIKQKIEESSAIVLASPVYYLNVTAQMKTFIDRMLAYGHRPTLENKYGGSITVYAGVGSVEEVAEYLNMVLGAWGIVPVGYATGFGVFPGEVGDGDIDKAKELGKRISTAFKEGYKRKASKKEIELRNQLINLIKNYGHFLKADYEFWREKGVID